MKTDEIITYTRKPKRNGKLFLSELFSGNMALLSVAAIMISRVTVLGSMAPFGIAWYAANICADKHYLILGATLLGTLLMTKNAGILAHVLSVILLFAIKNALPNAKWKSPAFFSGISAVCTAFSGMIFALFSGTFYFSLVTSLTEALAAGGMCLVFHKASEVIHREWKIVSDEESVSIAILAGCVVAGLQGISFFDIKPANVLSMYIILFTAYKGGVGISGSVGAALGIIAGISQGDAPALTGVYGFMGLVSGIMNIFGKVGVVISAAFANSIFAGFYNSSTLVLVNFIEILVAGLLFFFTPEKTLDYFEKYTMRSPVYDAAGGYVMRLKSSIGEALASLKNSATAISEAYAPISADCMDDEQKLIRERLVARVCDGCSLNKYCWNRNVKGSNLMFEKISADLINEKFDDMVTHITGRCVRGDTLCETAKEIYGILKREKIIKKRVDLYAKNFSDGWSDFLEIIKTKEEQIVNIKPSYTSFESQFCRELAARGIKSPEISMIMNDYGRFEISLRSAKEILFDIIPIAENVTSRKMCISDEYRTKNGFVIKLQEKLKFDYDVSIITMNKQGSDVSGDFAEWFVSPEGMFFCLVCDGMGSGEVANKDSARVVRLFKTLVLSGFEVQSAVKIINGGMISSDRGERCVSFDCVTVDLFTGKTDFIKAGAVASVIKTAKKVTTIRENSIPLGVLDIDSVPTQTLFLSGDSYIVMMTDGVTDNIGDRKKGEECIGSILELMEISSGREASDSIMMSAVAEGVPKDDMMVCAIKISGKEI